MPIPVDTSEVKIHKIPYPKLDLLEPVLEIYENGNALYVNDLLRKQRLLLTPEEWVRQHVLHWLLVVSNFPPNLLAIERQIGKTKKRADVVGYDRNGKPLLLVECKAPTEPIDEETARQALVYNLQLKSSFLWLTNGLVHQVFSIENEVVKTIPSLPEFGFQIHERPLK